MPLQVTIKKHCANVNDHCIFCHQRTFYQAGSYFFVSHDGRETRLGPVCDLCMNGGKEVRCTIQVGPQEDTSRRRRAVTLQERSRSEEIGGRRQTGSGAKTHYKADGRVDGEYRIECKSTTSKSFVVKLGDLTKIRSECAGLEVPLFEIEFWDKGTLQPLDRWVLVPWDAWRKKARC